MVLLLYASTSNIPPQINTMKEIKDYALLSNLCLPEAYVILPSVGDVINAAFGLVDHVEG